MLTGLITGTWVDTQRTLFYQTQTTMKRSYELLTAEQLQKDGFCTFLPDAINIMNNKSYSNVIFKNQAGVWRFVTIVFSDNLAVVYRIDVATDKIELLTKIGFE